MVGVKVGGKVKSSAPGGEAGCLQRCRQLPDVVCPVEDFPTGRVGATVAGPVEGDQANAVAVVVA